MNHFKYGAERVTIHDVRNPESLHLKVERHIFIGNSREKLEFAFNRTFSSS